MAQQGHGGVGKVSQVACAGYGSAWGAGVSHALSGECVFWQQSSDQK